MQNPMPRPIVSFYEGSNDPALLSFLTSFRRCFTLKDCLPELPRKIFYSWRDEGLVPESFGQEKELTVSENSDHATYKKWDRYHLYEMVWIRIVYHFRQIGLPKEYLIATAALNFPTPNAALKRIIEKQFRENAKNFALQKAALSERLGMKGADHEIQKINSTIVESLAMGSFHYAIFNAIKDRRTFDFVAQDGLIKIPTSGWYNDTGVAKPIGSLSTYAVLPFGRIMTDIILNSEPSFIQNLLLLNEKETKVADDWKLAATEMRGMEITSFWSPRAAIKEAIERSKQREIVSSKVFELCNKLLNAIAPADYAELSKFQMAAEKAQKQKRSKSQR